MNRLPSAPWGQFQGVQDVVHYLTQLLMGKDYREFRRSVERGWLGAFVRWCRG